MALPLHTPLRTLRIPLRIPPRTLRTLPRTCFAKVVFSQLISVPRCTGLQNPVCTLLYTPYIRWVFRPSSSYP